MSQRIHTHNDQAISSNGETTPLLVFAVDKQLYGLAVEQVVRIIEMVTIVHVHDLADYVKGIINYQSMAIPVIDMRRRLGFTMQEYELHTPIILVDISHTKVEQDNATHLIGLIVDDVKQIVHVPSAAIKTHLPDELNMLMSHHAAHLQGVTTIDRQLVLLLNIGALLNPDDYDTIKELHQS